MLDGDSKVVWLTKGKHKIVFDIKIKTPKGDIFAMYVKRKVKDEREVAAVVSKKKKPISAAKAHSILGHMNEEEDGSTTSH